MMSKDYEQAETKRHEQVWQLLPWYVNGTLDDLERETVARHVSLCQTCEDEIVRCRSLVSVLGSDDTPAWTHSPRDFDRLMTRIDRESSLTSTTSTERWRLRIHEWIEKIRAMFQSTPSPIRWALAGQMAVIVLIVMATMSTWIASPLPYSTLSDPVVGDEASQSRLTVVFAEDITEHEVRTLLSTIKGEIVAGPSAMAIYTVAIPASGDERSGQAQAALEKLRAHPKVRLAEPKQP
jgi:hypothetical protein